MSWIHTINYDEADGPLKKIYDRIKGPNGTIDNVLSIHSLRPHTLTGHMALYKSVLHNTHNSLPKWYLETLGVYVSLLNRCSYCLDHHSAGLRRLLNDQRKANALLAALESDALDTYFEPKYLEGLLYAKKLTLPTTEMTKSVIEALREVGFSDGEILEINQVTSYFNYVNRTVVGLGVTTKGDVLGLSPNKSDDPNDWGHSSRLSFQSNFCILEKYPQQHPMSFTLIDNVAQKRYEFQLPEHTPCIEYIKTKDKIYLTHTEVPVALEGQGIGSELVKQALEHIKEKELTLIPLCPFVAHYLKEHPQWKELVLKGINIA